MFWLGLKELGAKSIRHLWFLANMHVFAYVEAVLSYFLAHQPRLSIEHVQERQQLVDDVMYCCVILSSLPLCCFSRSFGSDRLGEVIM